MARAPLVGVGDAISKEDAAIINAHREGRPAMSEYELASVRIAAMQIADNDPDDFLTKTYQDRVTTVVNYALTGAWAPTVSSVLPKWRGNS